MILINIGGRLLDSIGNAATSQIIHPKLLQRMRSSNEINLSKVGGMAIAVTPHIFKNPQREKRLLFKLAAWWAMLNQQELVHA